MINVKTFDEPEFDFKEIFRYAGVKNIEDGSFLPDIESCLEELKGKLSYRVCYTRLPLNDKLVSGWMEKSANLSKNLEGCTDVVLFAATVGLEIDRLISRYGRISPSKAVFFQAIGAERIESLCNIFNNYIKLSAEKEGLFVRPRFSPGYGDFPLTAQKDIFRVLDPGRRIGVFLNDSMLMSPSKSVTAIIGISGLNKNCTVRGCKECSAAECEFRR